MSLRGFTSSVSKQDISGALHAGVKVLLDSGVPQRLQQPIDNRTGKGCPSRLPQYTALAVLGTWFQLLWANQPPSLTNMLRALWHDYTPEQLTILGLPADWRDPDRAQQMADDHLVHLREYNRLQTFVVDLLTDIDDTPVPATKNLTNAEIRAGRTNRAEELAPRTHLADSYSNDIIGASVPIHLLTGYRAALSTDLHAVGSIPARVADPTDDATVKLGPPSAGYYPRHRRLGRSFSFGVTLAIAVREPGQPPIPDIALGMGLGDPLTEISAASLTAIDAADRHPATKTTGSNYTRWVIGDNAYTGAVGFNAALNDRGRNILQEHSDRTGERRITTTYDLRAVPADPDGPHLVPGAILCPGIRGNVIRDEEIWRHPHIDHMTADELREHQQRLADYEAVRMPTDGRPVRAQKRNPGRPRTNAPEPETVFKVEVFCPARRKKVRCERYQPSLSNGAPHYIKPPEDTTSFVCINENPKKPTEAAATTLHLTPEQFKLYGPVMAGTFEHHDLLKHARAHNEGYHKFITMAENANLDDRTIRGRRNSTIRMTITLGVAIANLRSAAAFKETRKRNGGTDPDGARDTLIRGRAALLTPTA